MPSSLRSATWNDAISVSYALPAGTAIGTYMAAMQGFASSVYPLEIFGVTLPGYAALYSVVINFVVAALLSPVFDLMARKSAAPAAR